MNPNRWIGSTAVRCGTAVLAALSLTAALVYRRELVPGASGIVFAAAVVCGILAAIGFVHCFRAVYTWWMKFADVLQTVVVSILFGACYLLIVPIFALIVRILDPLRLSKRRETGTLWIRRRPDAYDWNSFERLG